MRTLWAKGRLALLFEPQDCWAGWFYDKDRRIVYLSLPPFGAPMFPLRYIRKV